MKFLSDSGFGHGQGLHGPRAARPRRPFRAPAERDFFAQVEAREPLLLRAHGYHWFDLARMEREPHRARSGAVPLLYNIWDSRAEGLATAMEEMMARAGLFEGRPRGRELVYVMIAQRAARGPGQPQVHGGEMTWSRPSASPTSARRTAGSRRTATWYGASSASTFAARLRHCYLSGKAQIECAAGRARAAARRRLLAAALHGRPERVRHDPRLADPLGDDGRIAAVATTPAVVQPSASATRNA